MHVGQAIDRIVILSPRSDNSHHRPAPNRPENVGWRESTPQSRTPLRNVPIAASVEAIAGNPGYSARWPWRVILECVPSSKPTNPVHQPYVSLGPRPFTTRGPARQEGASGPRTVMPETRFCPTTSVIWRCRESVNSRTWVAQAVESARRTSSPSVQDSMTTCAATSGPTTCDQDSANWARAADPCQPCSARKPSTKDPTNSGSRDDPDRLPARVRLGDFPPLERARPSARAATRIASSSDETCSVASGVTDSRGTDSGGTDSGGTDSSFMPHSPGLSPR